MPGSTVTNPLGANTGNRIEFDAGALYYDWNQASEAAVGSTRGGSVFTVEREDRDVEVDGGRIGPIRELVRNIREVARLECTFLEWSQTLLTRLLRGTVVSDGTYRTITPGQSIAVGDFLTNVALVATMKGTSTPIVLILKNVLERGQFTFTTSDNDEGRLPVMFQAHYTVSDLTTPPYEIKLPVSAS